MKTNRLICTAILVLTISSLSMSAQPPRGHYPEGRPRPEHHMVSFTPCQRAEQRTNEMDKAVRLDDKQYKKIYKIFLKEENAKESSMGNGGPMGPTPGQMGGFPPTGRPFPGDFGEPQKPTVGGKEIDSDEYIDAREAKIRKILSAEQYSKWRKVHPDPSGFFFE